MWSRHHPQALEGQQGGRSGSPALAQPSLDPRVSEPQKVGRTWSTRSQVLILVLCQDLLCSPRQATFPFCFSNYKAKEFGLADA